MILSSLMTLVFLQSHGSGSSVNLAGALAGNATALPPPCTLCVYPMGWTGWIEAGPGWVSDRNLKFADYRGLDEDGAFAHLAGTGRFLDEQGHYLYFRAENVALDSRHAKIRGGQQGLWQARLAYREVPKYRGFGAMSPYLGAGGARLTLPGSWESSFSAADLERQEEAFKPIDLRTDRKTLDLGFEHRLSSRWNWSVETQRQRKNGSRPFGAGALTRNTSHLPAPVDTVTDRIELNLDYRGRRGSLRGGFSGSWFDNKATELTWDNPFSATPGTETFRAALAPDNHYVALHLGGAYGPRPGIRLSGRLLVGRMRQNDPFIPYTINPELNLAPLPRSSLNGEVDVSSLDAAGSFSWRVAPRFQLDARYRRRERDNKTPESLWTPVITDTLIRPLTANRVYDFIDTRGTLEAKFRWKSGLFLRAGTRFREVERSSQAVRETDETTLWGELNFLRWAPFGIRLKFEHSDRDASEYQAISDPGLPGNPLMRKYNLADRQRDQITLDIDLTLSDRFSASLSWYQTRDDYDASLVGLREGESDSLNLDATYRFSDAFAFSAFVSRDRYDALILGQQNFQTPWNTVTRDDFLTFGFSGDAQLGNDMTLSFRAFSSDADGDIETRLNGDEPAFPSLTNQLANISASLTIPLRSRWLLRLDLEHERYRSTDWQWDNVDGSQLPAVLSFGLESPDYDITVVRALARYQF